MKSKGVLPNFAVPRWTGLFAAVLVGGLVVASGAASHTRRDGFPNGTFVTAVSSYTGADPGFKAREVLTVQGADVTVVMEVAPADARSGEGLAPVLTWKGRVIDSSRQVLTVKRDVGVERRFFRIRDDGVVEELTRWKVFSVEPKS